MPLDNRWLDLLHEHGAQIKNGQVIDVNSQSNAAGKPSLCALTDLITLEISGPDTAQFLQGQVTCDVNKLNAETATYGVQCNPKGRVIFSFLATRPTADSILLRIPASMETIARQSLGKYIVFSKAEILPTSATVVISLTGDKAGDIIEKVFSTTLTNKMAVKATEVATVIKHDNNRFECWLNPLNAEATWRALIQLTEFQPSRYWHHAEIAAGIPTIYPSTSEEFVPQTINLVEVGAVSFEKGCYTGQEVVARMQYLGKQKRHARIAHINTNKTPKPGDDLYKAGSSQSVGKVISAAQTADKQLTLLVSITDDAYENAQVSLADGPLTFGTLPYALESKNRQS